MSAKERFRAGVGAVIYKAGGSVLVLERSDLPGSWQFPQGGLHAGETVEDALYREIREETGLTKEQLRQSFEVPMWIGYELPEEMRRKKTGRGQVHRWFFLELIGPDSAITLGESGEFR